MHIAWGSLLIVLVVSFAAAVAVVVLVSFALVALSNKGTPSIEGVSATASASASGKAIAGLCLGAAGLIVLYGLYIIVR